MEHSVKLDLFPRSWRSEHEIMAVNTQALLIMHNQVYYDPSVEKICWNHIGSKMT